MTFTIIIGKIVNVADDVDAIYLEKSKNLKTMASGNTVGARAIYSQPITLKNTATLIFTANEPPVFKDKSDGIGRRLVIIPFDNKVKERIYNFDELLSTDNAKSYLLNLGLAGIKRIYTNKLEISTSETIEGATKQYYLDNDSVLSYLNDYPSINSLKSIETNYKKVVDGDVQVKITAAPFADLQLPDCEPQSQSERHRPGPDDVWRGLWRFLRRVAHQAHGERYGLYVPEPYEQYFQDKPSLCGFNRLVWQSVFILWVSGVSRRRRRSDRGVCAQAYARRAAPSRRGGEPQYG